MSNSFTFARKIARAEKVKNFTNKCTLQYTARNSHQRCLLTTAHCYEDDRYSNNYNQCKTTMLLGTSLAFLGFFEKKDKEEENPLITTIKRSILLIQVHFLVATKASIQLWINT